MKFHFVPVACILGCNLGIVTYSGAQPKKGVVDGACSVALDNCWSSLAQAVKTNPQASHFSVLFQEPQLYEVGGREMAAWIDYKWFYNKNLNTVDFKKTWWYPPVGWGFVEIIKSYRGISPDSLDQFLKLPKKPDRTFEGFCQVQGAYVLQFPNEADPHTSEHKPKS